MRDDPGRGTTIIFQRPVRDRQVLEFENILHVEAVGALITHNEPDCVCGPLLWQSRTRMRVPEVTGLEFYLTELYQFSSGRKTCSTPASAEREACRMR